MGWRRAERLFQIVQLLRDLRIATAEQLAGELGVSVRTVYRDIADLSLSVPISAVPGKGYSLLPGYDLPPLMFTREEIEAIVLGARFVEGWADVELARSAASALAKVRRVLPAGLRESLDSIPMHALVLDELPERKSMAVIRRAIKDRRPIRMSYSTPAGEVTDRVIEPLGLFYWGKVWTAAAWCRLRQDFRSFRLDRIESPAIPPGGALAHTRPNPRQLHPGTGRPDRELSPGPPGTRTCHFERRKKSSLRRHQFVWEPSRRCRWGISENLNGSVSFDSSTSTPRPGWSSTVTLPGSIVGCTGKTSLL